MELYESGELSRRIEDALRVLERCTVCPRDCHVNRLADERKLCRVGRRARVASYFPHFGEEDCLRGHAGSGTIFFSWCNLKCVFCFHPDTLLSTTGGLKRIADVFETCADTEIGQTAEIGTRSRDLVYLRDGSTAGIVKAFRHEYRGHLLSIKATCCPPLQCTPDHEVFAAHRSDPARVIRLAASEVTCDHYMVVPKRAGREERLSLDVAAILSNAHVRPTRKRRRRASAVDLTLAFASGQTSGDIATALGYHPAYVRALRGRWRRGEELEGEARPPQVCIEGRTVRFEWENRPGVPGSLSLDERLGWLLGYYCAEGHVSAAKTRPRSARVCFSAGRHEQHLAEKAARLLREVFHTGAFTVHRRTTISAECYKASVAHVFATLCGKGSREKRVPAEILRSPKTVLRAFLDGYLAGDGTSTGRHYVGTTVSRDLALGLFELGLSLDALPAYYQWTPEETKRIEGRLVRQSPVHYVKFVREHLDGGARPQPRGGSWLDRGTHFLVRVREVEAIPYEGPVYNLHVDHPDHSYVASFLAVGNCQNWDISNEGEGEEVSAERLALMMLELQRRGCHNINFVTPEHVVPQVLEALPYAIERGLRLPIVYNTSAYDSLHSLRLMDGVVDIYMPDFKYWDAKKSSHTLKALDYPDVARAAIREMHRQVGDLVVGGDGLAKRGLLVRHLVMPGELEETRQILTWLAEEISPRTYVNVMDQYYPAGRVAEDPKRYPHLARRLTAGEHLAALRVARDAGLDRIDARRPHPLLGRRLRLI